MEKTHQSQPTEPFVASVESIRAAEEQAAEIVRKAEERSAKLIAASREKAIEIGVKASDEAVSAKNKSIAKGRAETDRMIEATLEGARKKCERISSVSISEADARELAKKIQL